MATIDLVADFKQLLASVPTEPSARATELLLRSLEPSEAELLRRCAIPHQFDISLLAILAPDLRIEQLQSYYASFTQLPIITPAAETLAMHDRSRKYLFQKWLEPERQEEFTTISHRLVHFFEGQAASGPAGEGFSRRRMFHLIGAEQDRGFEEFDRLCRERRRQLRLTDCQNLIALAHEYDEVLTRLNRIRLAYAEGKLAADLRDWERATALFENIDHEHDAPPEYRIKALNRLGMVYADQRRLDEAIDYYKRARELSASQDDSAIYRTLVELGAVYRDKGDFPLAEQLLGEGIGLAEQHHSFYTAAVGYNSSGMLHRQLRDIPRAIRDYEQSLDNLEKVGDKFRRGQVLSELGVCYSEQRDWAAAEKYLKESLEIERQAGDKHNQAIVQNNLMAVYRNSGRPKEALEAAREAMRLFQETRDYYRGAMATRNFGKLCRASKDRAGCEQAFKDAIAQFRCSHEIGLAEETERELAALGKKIGLPWWTWVIIGLIVSVLVYIILLFAGVVK